jgi:hypothetical protein
LNVKACLKIAAIGFLEMENVRLLSPAFPNLRQLLHRFLRHHASRLIDAIDIIALLDTALRQIFAVITKTPVADPLLPEQLPLLQHRLQLTVMNVLNRCRFVFPMTRATQDVNFPPPPCAIRYVWVLPEGIVATASIVLPTIMALLKAWKIALLLVGAGAIFSH